MDKPNIINPPSGFYEALHKALGIDSCRVRRIVIDVPLKGPPIIYTEMIGDERFVSIVQAFDGIHVEHASE